MTQIDNQPRLIAPPSGLDVAAVICACLVSPVGIVLGLVSRSEAKRNGAKASTLATISIIIGSIITGLSVIATVVIIVVAAGSVGAASTRADCATLTRHTAVLSSFQAADTGVTGDTVNPDDWKTVDMAAETVRLEANEISNSGPHDAQVDSLAATLSKEAKAVQSAIREGTPNSLIGKAPLHLDLAKTAANSLLGKIQSECKNP